MNIGDILLFTANSILPLILLIVLGYWLKKIGFFTKEFLKIGNKTVFYVCLPALLFKNIADIDDFSQIRLDVVGYKLIIIFLLLFAGFLVTLFIPDVRQKGVLHQCIFRSNFALIGVPLAELIGGSRGVRIAAILSMFSIPIFNIASVVVLSLYQGKNTKPDGKKILKGILTNPLIISVVCGMVFAAVKLLLAENGASMVLQKVSFAGTTITFLSKAATPLALLVLGGQFEFQKMTAYKKPLLIGVFGRCVIAPLLGVGIAGILVKLGSLSFEPEVFAALIALFGTPVAVASAIMAEAMDNDGQLAGQLVVWTSLISIITLSVCIAICRGVGLL